VSSTAGSLAVSSIITPLAYPAFENIYSAAGVGAEVHEAVVTGTIAPVLDLTVTAIAEEKTVRLGPITVEHLSSLVRAGQVTMITHRSTPACPVQVSSPKERASGAMMGRLLTHPRAL
jgi:hypothetical protein